MKKTFLFYPILILAASIVFFSCRQHTQERQIQLLVDSTAYLNDPASDTASILESTSADQRMTTVPKSSAAKKPQTRKPTYTPTTNSSSQGGSAGTAQGNENKGWSKAAQGAVIGGATGAVGGAIISKNKGAGAAVGAAVGAAGGYIIGREKDKKDGRVPKKKKNQ